MATLFGLPDGYEVLLGNGGTSLFWDAATGKLLTDLPGRLLSAEEKERFAKMTAVGRWGETGPLAHLRRHLERAEDGAERLNHTPRELVIAG